MARAAAVVVSMTSRANIVVADTLDEAALARLHGAAHVVVVDGRDVAALSLALRDADGLVVRTYTRVTERVLDAAPKLRVIGRAGVGVDNIDISAARRRGIVVVHTPAAATDAVADLTVGLMLAVLRNVASADALVRAGRFDEARAQPVAVEMGSLTLGVVGLGRIGRAVARRCFHGFGMRVLFTDIVDPGRLPCPATALPLEDLLRRCDVLSLHVPLTRQTRGMIDDRALGVLAEPRMGDAGGGDQPADTGADEAAGRVKSGGVILLNTARGPVVDTDALVSALQSGGLAGAGLDVTDPEPLPAGHPLLTDPRVVLTPHAGARTQAAHARMCAVVDDVLDVLAGRPPRFAVPDDASALG